MDKRGEKLFGFFDEQILVQEKIEELREKGYTSDNMYIVAKDNESINSLHSYSDVHFSTEQDGDWIAESRKIDAGTPSLKKVFEKMGFSNEVAEGYNKRIANGEIFLFADDEDSSKSGMPANFPASESGLSEPGSMSRTERRKQLMDTEEESLLLHEEQLEIQKERVQTGEINVNKRLIEEQQHMDVPIERDDVTIERRKIPDTGVADEQIKKEPYQVGDELHIPIIEEKIIVTKKEVVTEEIIVTKKKIKDIEHISETLRREEVDIDDSDLPAEDKRRNSLE